MFEFCQAQQINRREHDLNLNKFCREIKPKFGQERTNFGQLNPLQRLIF